jgi:hypothetical protein
MRNGVLSTIAAGLLGGAAAFGIGASQSPSPSVPLEQHAAQAAAAAPGAVTQLNVLSPTPAAAITQETIDCTVFNSARECQVVMILRAPSAPAPSSPSPPAVSTPPTTRTRTPSAPAAKNVAATAPAEEPPSTDRELHAVLIGTRGDPVAVDLKVECATDCTGQTVKFNGKPVTAVKVILSLPECWRHGLTPRVATGLIGLATSAKPGRLEFEGTPKRLRVLAPAPSRWQSSVILVSGSLALVVGLFAAVASSSKLRQRMGAPSWSGADSWGTNLTVGAGLVNGVLAIAVLTDTTAYMTKSSYTALSMILASLVLLAPIVFGLFRREVDVAEEASESADPSAPVSVLTATTKEFEGYVIVFIVAGSLTLWASLGQLMTFALLIGELRIADVIGTGVAVVVVILVAVVAVGLLIYGFVAMREAAKTATEASTTKSAAGRESRDRTARPPRWSLL